MKITRAEWRRYRKVQDSGRYNMITEWKTAADAAGLTRTRYLHIVMYYATLRDKFEPKITKVQP